MRQNVHDLIVQPRPPPPTQIRTHRFLTEVEDGYPDNPYHNRTHAADVLHTMHFMMTKGGVGAAMGAAKEMATLACYFAVVRTCLAGTDEKIAEWRFLAGPDCGPWLKGGRQWKAADV